MPQLRSEQIQSETLHNLNVAVNAAIEQSKIADHISDPHGWISKGTITFVDSFGTLTPGYQEFGLNVLGSDNTGLTENTVYYFEVNGKEYSIDTTGLTAPISYSQLVSLMDTEVTSDNLQVLLTGDDIRIISTLSGYDSSVRINPYCTRHRLHDYLLGFAAFEESVQGSGVDWDGSQAGRLFFSTSTNEIYIGISTDPYYQALGGEGQWQSLITVKDGAEGLNWNGTTATIFRSQHSFVFDASNLFVYLNGQLLEHDSSGSADYQVVQGVGTASEYTDVVINPNYTIGVGDKVTMIVYDSASLNAYATKAWVTEYVTEGTPVNGDLDVSGHLLPSTASMFDIGSDPMTWRNLYLADSIYFRPMGEINDNLRIYRNTIGTETQMRFQIGSTAEDKMIFEDENNTEILSIDGDGNVNIPGDLVVSGDTTFVSTSTLNLEDADLIIHTSTPAIDADGSYQIQRASGNSQLRWNESLNRWQAVYGSTAEITSTILTENDLTSGTNLDARYLNHDQVVVAGSAETQAALRYSGSFTTAGAIAGSFYGGTFDPTDTTRLNYNGNLHVNALYAEDVHVSASSLYVNGSKVIEDDSNVITFRADLDQSVNIKTLGTGNLALLSDDEINANAVGGMQWDVPSTSPSKHINFTNASAGGNITFTATGSAGQIQIGAGSANIVGLDTTTNDPTATTRLNIHGHVYGTKVYNAVWNDIVDFLQVEDTPLKFTPGKVYVLDENYKFVESTQRCQQGIVGIVSDTYGFGVGEKQNVKQAPIAIGGYVLAHVDKKYPSGTPLTSGEDGVLTEMTIEEKRDYPERLVGTFLRPENQTSWNGVSVNGRHWIKVK